MRTLRILLIAQSIIIIGLGFTLWNVLSVDDGSTSVPEETVHLHADLRVVLNGTAVNFAQDNYREQNENVHMHEGSEPVVHVHAPGIVWSDFFSSLKMNLTDECLTLDTGESYCTGDGNELRFYVNGVATDSIVEAKIADLQRVMVYFGTPDDKTVQAELVKVTNNACVESGTCMGRDDEEAAAAALEAGCTGTEPCKE